MRKDCLAAIESIKQYLNNDVFYPFLVAANASSDISMIYTSIPDYVKALNSSDFCSEDGLPDEDALFDTMKRAASPLIVKGVGDSIMLSGDASFLWRVAGQTFSQKIVILCRNQGVQLERLHQQNTKFGDNRWCELEKSADVSIIRVASDVAIDKTIGYKALVKKLEDCASGKLYVTTEVAIHSTKVITNAYDAIREANPSFVIPEEVLSKEQWSAYLRDPYLEVSDPFHWRSYLRLLMNGTSSPYFRLVLQYSPDYTSYRRELINAILHVPYSADSFQQLYLERKMFLRQHPEVEISEYVRDSYAKDEGRIHYLTDNTIIEKHAIVEEIARHGLHLNDVEEVYPDLAAYFTEYTFSGIEHELFTKYFTEYKKQKATNVLSDAFLSEVEELSKPGQRKYNTLPTRNMLILQMKDSSSGLYWIDALGVEYLGYIKTIAKEIGLWLDIRVGRASLPTLTDINRDFYDSWSGFKYPKESRLDDRKHEGAGARASTDPAIHLADELAIIRESLSTIKNGLLEHKAENFLLVSDHGASRLCVLHQHENQWQINNWRMEENGKHSGHCCLATDADECPESATLERDYWVLANYDRFKGGRRANVEVHGGASLEEVLVPVIRVKLPSERIICQIHGCNESVGTIIKPLEGPVVLPLYCSKPTANIAVLIKGKTYTGKQRPTNPCVFDVDLSVWGEIWHPGSTYEAIVSDGDNEVSTVQFKVQRNRRTTRNDRDGTDFFGI